MRRFALFLGWALLLGRLPAAESGTAPAVDPRAAGILERMGAFYAGLDSAEVDLREVLTIQPKGVPIVKETVAKLAFERPNKVAFTSTKGSILSDGSNLVAYSPHFKKYTSVASPKRLSSILDDLDTLVVLTDLSAIPELFAKRPFVDSLGAGAVGFLVGHEVIGKTPVDHLRLNRAPDQFDLWIAEGPEPLLIRYQFAFQKESGLKDCIDFDFWRLHRSIPPETFHFDPPADTPKVADLYEDFHKADPPHPLVGKTAPGFELRDLLGKAVSLASLRGKVVVLDFWATWCGPCVKTLPIVADTTAPFAGRGVVFYAVNIKESAEQVRKFQADKDLPVPVLLDADGKVSNLYLAKSIPQSVVIGKDGQIAAVHVGFRSDLGEKLTGELNTLLDAK